MIFLIEKHKWKDMQYWQVKSFKEDKFKKCELDSTCEIEENRTCLQQC